MFQIIAVLVLCFTLCSSAQAVPVMERSVLGHGGGTATVGTLTLGSTIGETITGSGAHGYLNYWLGFWMPKLDPSAVELPPTEPPQYFLRLNQPDARSITYGVGADHSVMVHLGIYDVRGRLVRELAGGIQPPGMYTITWNGSMTNGSRIASGLYFLSFRTGDFVQTHKFVVFN